MASPAGVPSGITLSRTLVPTLPPSFLSRKHLFPLLDRSAASTMVIAPQGFGKTTLVAEWAAHHRDEVIWLTISEDDALQEMSTLFIQATRNLIPGFGEWFEANQPMRASEVVERWGRDLLATGRKFIFVLDNLRNDYSNDVEISNKLIAAFPSNVHFVALRRTPLETLNKVLLFRGNINTLTTKELRFTDGEISALAENIGVDRNSKNFDLSVGAAQGWPSAVSLILHQMQVDPNRDFKDLLSNKSTPLNALAKMALDKLSPSDRESLSKLSVVSEFTYELAEEILGTAYSFEALSDLANQGQIISPVSSEEHTYVFSPLMQSVLQEDLAAQPANKREIHSKLSRYFLKHQRFDLAMDHAFAAGDQAMVSSLFRDAARIKHSQGKGDDLLRWSVYAGNSPEDGSFKRETMEIAGLLSNLDYSGALAKVEKMRLTYAKAMRSEFFAQFTESSAAFISFAFGKFEEFDSSFERVFNGERKVEIAAEEQIMLLRLGAQKAFIFDDAAALEKISEIANSLAHETTSETAHAYLGAIKALTLFEKGEYLKSFEVASIALRNFQRNAIVGLLGPVDIYFVLARALLEFSRRDEAFEHFERASSLARQWGLWPWYVMSEGYFARDIALTLNFQEALARIRSTRDAVAKNYIQGDLNLLVDLSEIFVRHQMHDLEKLHRLVERGLKIRFVEQMKLMVDEQLGKKDVSERVRNLPGNNPREIIWKHLADALENIGTESVALSEMKKALKVGAEVGAKETFLRQGNDLGTLIIKAANQNPTMYNEELARAMAVRMKEREMTKSNSVQALTKREKEILSHLATGRTLTAIAADLHISQNTMKTHLKNLYKKMGAEGRHDAVDKAKAGFLI